MSDNTYDKGRLNLPFVGICTFGKYPYVQDWDKINADVAVLGEVGLGGEVRAVSHIDQRLKEAMHLGFTRAVVPTRQLKGLKGFEGLELLGVSSVSEAIRLFF